MHLQLYVNQSLYIHSLQRYIDVSIHLLH
jgi:hypothetical protein